MINGSYEIFITVDKSFDGKRDKRCQATRNHSKTFYKLRILLEATVLVYCENNKSCESKQGQLT